MELRAVSFNMKEKKKPFMFEFYMTAYPTNCKFIDFNLAD